MTTRSVESLGDALFGKAKRAAIGILFSNPDRSIHLRELARLSSLSAPAMGKELDLLCAVGLVKEKRDGNRRVFSANTESPIFKELASIANKTAGVADVIRDALMPVPGIDLAFIFGSVAKNTAKAHSDVDVFILGDIDLASVLDALGPAQELIGRTVNPLIYSIQEFRSGLATDNSFLSNMLETDRIFLIGTESDIADFRAI